MRCVRLGMGLVLVVGLMLASGGRAQAITLPTLWTVCNSGCSFTPDFTDIQSGINDPRVKAGDTLGVYLGAGTPYAGFVDTFKPLIVEGMDPTPVTLQGGSPVISISTGTASQPMFLQNLIVTGGSSTSGAGGIVSSGTLTVKNSTISNNSSSTTGANVHGGGIDNTGALTVSGSTISGNSSSSNYVAGGGGVYNGGTLSVTGSSIQNNSATSSFSPGSIATDGAGIYNAAAGSASVTNSTIAGNTGGTFTSAGASAAAGGGIYNAGTFTVVGTTINGNHTDYGGGIWIQGGSLTLANSTVDGNNAANGGGIYASGGTATIINSTITGNHADSAGGGLSIDNSSSPALSNTILAGNDVSSGGVGPDCDGSLGDGTAGHNLLGNASFCSGLHSGVNGDQVGVANPGLGTLAGNGGPTQTVALLPGSPAIDAGDNTTCAGSPVNNIDQRGVTRPFGFVCDIGAFESVGIPVPINPGWNLIDLPISDPSLGSLAGLVTAFNNQLGAGSVSLAATYTRGRYLLYVPGYSGDVPLQSWNGIFVLSAKAGTWNGFGTASGSAYYGGSQQAHLQPGWNLVAAPYPYHSLQASTIARQIDSICAPGPCSVKELAAYTGGQYTTYIPGGGGTDFSVPSTNGLWVLMEYAATWTPH